MGAEYQELMDALEQAFVIGGVLAGFLTIIVQGLKNWLKWEGEKVKWLALGSGTILGSLYLIFVFPIQPQGPFDYILRIAVSVIFSMTSPALYTLLKQTSGKAVLEEDIHASFRSATKEAIQQIEEEAVLGASRQLPPE